jgi:hypothetical protein
MEMIMRFYWPKICWKEAVAKLNRIPEGELQYSAPIYFCEFILFLNPQRPARPDPIRSRVAGSGTGAWLG